MRNKKSVDIYLEDIEDNLKLTIDERREETLFIAEDYLDNLEAKYQLKEGFSYDYEFSDKTFSFAENPVVQPHIRNRHIGTISPNIYVGTLQLGILRDGRTTNKNIELEVQSLKADYRNEYRDMLAYITEQCTELLFETDSPVAHHFETDYSEDSHSLYQRFSFIKSILFTDEFTEAVHRIISAPVTKWKEEAELRDVRSIKRFRNIHVREMICGSNRISIPKSHFLCDLGVHSVHQKITTLRKTDTVDTVENRFVKYALEVFLKFCDDINRKAKKYSYSRLKNESELLHFQLESWLQHSVFKDISRPSSLKINSPVLQRKEGYREVLRVWLMFDLAARLVWKGGDDVYNAGKKDISVLYEYWLFFKLINLFKTMFSIEPKQISELVQQTAEGLNLSLKQGKHTALKGVYTSETRKLNIHFHYNRSFSGKKDYPYAGSWTTTMRPDYTLSFWPEEIEEKEAEEQEIIVHIHFDAKYKIANLTDLLENFTDKNLDSEKKENRRGIYKNADLLKMHAYKDAIRRTGGAYVLYPGDFLITKRGFHEIIPGLGAFPVRPSKTEDGIGELRNFVLEVINHFCNRASQRERIAYRNYEVYSNDNPLELREPAPEPYGINRDLIPDETSVVVAYYKQENWDWIIRTGLYNARAGNDRGSLRLGPGESGAKYLLLHTKNETITDRLLKITEIGPRIFSKEQLKNKSYPSEPTQDFYLV